MKKDRSGIILFCIISAMLFLYFFTSFSIAGAIVNGDVDIVTLEPVSIQQEAE